MAGDANAWIPGAPSAAPLGQPPAAQPQQPSNPLLQRALALLKGVPGAIDNLQKTPVLKALGEYAQLPAEGVNAVLGAPQRVTAERLANVASNPVGVGLSSTSPLFGPVPALLHPRGREELGHEVYAAFHPNDPTTQQRAEHATGVEHLTSSDPGPWHALQNFLVHTGFQTLTDPLTFTGAGTEVAGEHALDRIGETVTQAMRDATHPHMQNVASTFATNVDERVGGYTPQQIAAINSVRNRGITKSRLQQTIDENLLRQEQRNLAQGVISPRLRQRILQEPYVSGTPEMRQQAVAFGYIPTPREAALEPTSALDYNLREEYDPHTGMMRDVERPPEAPLLIGQTKRLHAPEAGMEKPQTGHVTPETLAQRVERRLATGRANVQFRETSNLLQKHVGVGKEMAGAMAQHEQAGGLSPLQAFSRMQVDALLATGLPHMRNIGVLGFLSMGEPGMARATQFFTRGIPQELLGRLEESGGASHFGIRTPGKISPARLLPRAVRGVTTGMLDRWDSAVRAARLEQLDKTASALPELEKMNRVNQDLGAYNLKPHIEKLLTGFGANFPQWHNYIVPTAVGRAWLRQPGRVERLARVEQNANDAIWPQSKSRLTLGGPVDEAASAAADPVRIAQGKYPTYFGGPSSIGPLSYLLPHGYTVKPSERIAETMAGIVPFGNVALDALLNPFKSPLPPGPRAATSLAGLYTQKRPPGSLSRTKPAPLPVKPAATSDVNAWIP